MAKWRACPAFHGDEKETFLFKFSQAFELNMKRARDIRSYPQQFHPFSLSFEFHRHQCLLQFTTPPTSVTHGLCPVVEVHNLETSHFNHPDLYCNPGLDPANFLEGPLSSNSAARLQQMLARPGIIVSITSV